MSKVVADKPTAVIFRVDSDGYTFALFPELPGTPDPATCSGYAHVGQHFSAPYLQCIATSRPAKPAAYARLRVELMDRGYTLRIYQRASFAMYQKRARLLRRLDK